MLYAIYHFYPYVILSMDSMQSFINYTKILYQLETNIMLYSKCYAKHNGLFHSLSHTQWLHELSID